MDISNRTYGLELEFGDVDRSKVDLPVGWGWSPNERSIVNSNATKCTPTGNFGGELNTKPLKRTLGDYRQLKQVIDSCYNAGGVNMWNTGFDGHLYIGDLELEELKKLFVLGYYTQTLMLQVFDYPDWFDIEHLCPKIKYDFVGKVKNAKSISALRNVFANSSNVGHFRFVINIMPYFKTKTLEFRFFNGTRQFRKTLETINFMYSFLEYAINHEEEDYKQIDTKEKFLKAFGIKKEMPKRTDPLIFAESYEVAVRNISKGFPPTKKILTAILHHTEGKISLINPFNYVSELALYSKRKIKIYNNNEHNYIVRELALGNLDLTYDNHFAVLNGYKDGTPERELCLFFIFSKTQKFDMKYDYANLEWQSYRARINDSIDKINPTALEMVKMFKEVEYVDGTIRDALNNKEIAIYQQEYNSKNNSTVTALKKNSSYDSSYERQLVSYHDLNIDSPLLVVSKNEFLPYETVAKDMSIRLYSNRSKYEGLRTPDLTPKPITYKTPPDDFKITPDSNITIQEIPVNLFSLIQQKCVKKVSKFRSPVFSYVIMCDDIVLGAVGFDWGKNMKSEYDLFVLSDFCTNNNIRLMSKFILFCIKTVEMKKLVERKGVQAMNKAYTLVYTTQPVSMKYRGAFKKVKNDSPRSLKYEFEFGSIGTIKDAIKEYLKRTK